MARAGIKTFVVTFQCDLHSVIVEAEAPDFHRAESLAKHGLRRLLTEMGEFEGLDAGLWRTKEITLKSGITES